MNNHCRISKVTFRDGKTLNILPSRPERTRNLIDGANKILDYGDPIDGFLILAWDNEGGYSYDYHMGDMKTITLGLMPAWVHDILLREIIQNDMIYLDNPGDGA